MGASVLKLLIFIIVSHAGYSQVVQPGNSSAEVVYACEGRTTTLQFNHNIDSRIEFAKYIKWFFHGGNSTDLVAVFINEQFLPAAKYHGRVSHLQDNGVILRNVTVNDSGIYRIETLISQINSSARHQLHNYSLYLQVSDVPMIQDGRLRVRQDQLAVWNTTSQQWTIRLLCGAFTFRGQPPIQVEWTLPGGETRASNGYENGHFYLSLSTPVVSGGQNTCRIPRQYYPQVCLSGSKVTEASVIVDEVRARLTLAEAEQGRLRLDSSRQEVMMTNLSRDLHGTKIELLQMQQSLVDLIQAVRDDFCRITYTTINDANGVRDLSSSSRGDMCDNTMTAGWYRWLLRGQDAIIPTSCTPVYKCGTHGTMWIDLKGQPLPSVGREVLGRACVSWSSNCCLVEIPSVTVRSCGSYYIYYLPSGISFWCSRAYCLQRKF